MSRRWAAVGHVARIVDDRNGMWSVSGSRHSPTPIALWGQGRRQVDPRRRPASAQVTQAVPGSAPLRGGREQGFMPGSVQIFFGSTGLKGARLLSADAPWSPGARTRVEPSHGKRCDPAGVGPFGRSRVLAPHVISGTYRCKLSVPVVENSVRSRRDRGDRHATNSGLAQKTRHVRVRGEVCRERH